MAGIDGLCWFWWAFLVLAVPWQWLLCAGIGAAVHELAHAAAVYLCGGRIIGLRIGIFGAEMTCWGLNKGQELLCVLAGPAASLLLGLWYRRYPLTALFALAQGLFNLLPVYPLDGGRLLSGLLELVQIRQPGRICRVVEWGTLVLLCGCLIVGGIRHGGGLGPTIWWIPAVLCLCLRKRP